MTWVGKCKGNIVSYRFTFKVALALPALTYEHNDINLEHFCCNCLRRAVIAAHIGLSLSKQSNYSYVTSLKNTVQNKYLQKMSCFFYVFSILLFANFSVKCLWLENMDPKGQAGG